MSSEFSFTPWKPWSSDVYSLFDASLPDTKVPHPSVAGGRSTNELHRDIAAKLEGLKNVAWQLGESRFETIPAAQIDAAIDGLAKAMRKIDETVWDKTGTPGRHCNPLHCFRRYARKQSDVPDTKELSKSARHLHESLQHIDGALSGLLTTTSTLCAGKESADNVVTQANLISDVRTHLDAARRCLPSSKNRFNTKAVVVALLAAASIAITVCAFVASGGTIAAALFAFGIAVTLASSINTILNQRFYQRDTGWNEFSKAIDKLHDLTITQLEQRMNTVNSYRTLKGIEHLTQETGNLRNDVRHLGKEMGEARNNIGHLRRATDGIDKRTTTIGNDIAGLRAAFTGHSSDIADIRTALSGQSNDISNLRSSMDALNATMERMRRDFEAARST
ncbi:Chromosome partition protein Smc [Pandoraea iniqua]|uniref:hypothetical protein n=1 Tax=Pandoraea iniqua TaxID=2508288 RepID=UPI001242D481|nr:hypothetical protein [Pandoraea iniqua]VVD59979.1 Chromosome partition protein Smc [Pandoraea iniqua]